MKVLVIYTGGTIGMVKNLKTGSLEPGDVNTINQFIKSESLSNDVDIISTNRLIDSSNFNISDFQELAQIISSYYHQYKAILILMGTDTMAYVSSLLSYCVSGLGKSIVFTGGQSPLYQDNSDSKRNLKESIINLSNHNFPKEVGIYFNKKWHRAVNAIKVDSQNDDAYATPNYRDVLLNFNESKFELFTSISSKVSVFKFLPWQNLEILKLILDSNLNQGIVLEAYGAGNLPCFDDELVQKFEKSIKKGLRVVVVSQCLKGGVKVGAYAASKQIEALNFINGGSMSLESASAKLLYCLGKKMNIQEISSFFDISFRGE